MFSRFHAKLLNLGSGDLLDSPRATSRLPRLMNDPGFISPGLYTESSDSDTESSRQSTGRRERMIIVANFLPLISEKDPTTSEWRFKLDEDSLLWQLKDGFSPETRVIYVGRLKAEIDPHMQDEVAQKLYKEFHCMPTFLAPDVQDRFYHGFCKNYLWPLFHYMLPLCPDHGDRFDRSLWQAYVAANKTFADTVLEVIHSNDDYVWAHDYHLLLLPTFLRKRLNCVKLGFFLHSPFPSSEIYRTLPVRDEILKGLLNADLIGFHTFDYARHFLSCCSRMLGLDYESKRGYIGLEYYGRTVNIKILPVGSTWVGLTKVKEIEKKFEGKTLILGVDDMDVFKGISLKLQAVEELLMQHPFLRGKLVMVQIVNPARSSGKDVQEAKKEADEVAKRVNKTYGFPGYNPVVMIDQPIDSHEKIAFYSAAECCIVNAVRDGMNLVPYKYVVCRQGTGKGSPQTSALVVSEFVGCSPSLSGAIRVNPWNIEAVAEAIYSAITLLPSEKQLRHEKHYNYIRSHDIAYWARSFLQDLERSCKDHYSRRCWGIGLGLGFRVVALSPSFRKLSVDHIVSAYKRTKTRAIFLDYDGTVMPRGLISKSPSGEVISILNGLCNDPQNTVFIVEEGL
ncbi:putative alpha,alpha-trehalose-phosphate synthase [UDP-forming] 8 [Acorus calamus]|uniref:Alpha,alpha-trehalose-phosphate synthase [UDP-forming] 8 n=1 Tax=Acorus calamus TaxID=4465 RepID=A0AAV9ED93_ACOCL|nr:putative alpha,alpha-trehalose-phosphate synthase [UDP-forming] 8 [Acorus calamus]